MNLTELAATLFLLVAVFLNARAIAWGWPLGIVGLAMSLPVYFQSDLYADFGLSIIYILLSLYGWWAWLKGGKKGEALPISRSGLGEQVLLLLVSGFASLALGYSLDHHTDADLPYWDAATTCFSLAGQWLLARKRLENWIWWLVIDFFYVGIYYYKGLFFFAGLYAVYLGLATYGWIYWRKIWLSEKSPS